MYDDKQAPLSPKEYRKAYEGLCKDVRKQQRRKARARPAPGRVGYPSRSRLPAPQRHVPEVHALMARTLPLSENFDQGFVSDVSRDELGPAAFRMRDWIPQLDAPLRKRGGWGYGSPTSGLGGTAASVASGGYLPFAGDGHVSRLERGERLPAQAVRRRRRRARHGHGRHEHRPDLAGLLAQDGHEVLRHHPRRPRADGQGAEEVLRHDRRARVPVAAARRHTAAGAHSASRGATTSCSATTTTRVRATLNNYRSRSAPSATRTRGRSPASTPRRSTSPRRSSRVPVRNAILVWGYDNCHIAHGRHAASGRQPRAQDPLRRNGTFDGRSVAVARLRDLGELGGRLLSRTARRSPTSLLDGGISNYYRQARLGLRLHAGVERGRRHLPRPLRAHDPQRRRHRRHDARVRPAAQGLDGVDEHPGRALLRTAPPGRAPRSSAAARNSSSRTRAPSRRQALDALDSERDGERRRRRRHPSSRAWRRPSTTWATGSSASATCTSRTTCARPVPRAPARVVRRRRRTTGAAYTQAHARPHHDDEAARRPVGVRNPRSASRSRSTRWARAPTRASTASRPRGTRREKTR
jgi:hypothetical protein